MRTGTTSGSKESLHEWLDVVARRYAVSHTSVSRGGELKGVSDDWKQLGLPVKTLVAYEPRSRTEWQQRLRVAEQMAATALVARPYAYSITLPTKKELRGDNVEVIRCAFGLSVTSGPMRLWQMTAYHIHPWNIVAVNEGRDHFFPLPSAFKEAAIPRDSGLEKRLEQICSRMREVQLGFSQGSEIGEIRKVQRAKLSAEIAALDSLYFDELYQRGLLQGVPVEGFSGDPAIEAEYRRRLDSLVKRHTVTIQLRVLSLGVIFCRGKRRKTKAGVEISLPFAHFKDAAGEQRVNSKD